MLQQLLIRLFVIVPAPVKPPTVAFRPFRSNIPAPELLNTLVVLIEKGFAESCKFAVPLWVTLPKVEVPAINICATFELKSTVLVAPVNVPLFVQLPLTPKVFAPLIVKVALLFIVIF